MKTALSCQNIRVVMRSHAKLDNGAMRVRRAQYGRFAHHSSPIRAEKNFTNACFGASVNPRLYPSEKAYRQAVIAEAGQRPHPFVLGEPRWTNVPACAVCRNGRAFFAHDDDLVRETETLDDFLAIAVWELAYGPGDGAYFTKKIRDLVAQGARLRPQR